MYTHLHLMHIGQEDALHVLPDLQLLGRRHQEVLDDLHVYLNVGHEHVVRVHHVL
jgi:hypothetical protein